MIRCPWRCGIAPRRAAGHNPAPMKLARAFAVFAGLILGTSSLAQEAWISRASRLEEQGRFQEAAAVLEEALAQDHLAAAARRQLTFERERLDRIRQDFSYTRDTLFAALQQAVKDLTAAEFAQWLAEGRFDYRDFDGERRYMDSSVSNLFFRHPELNPRRQPPRDTTQHDRAVYTVCTTIRDAARAARKPYVLPKRFHMTMTVTAKADAAPAGETVRAWLPLPRRYPFQTDFKLLKTSSPVVHLAPETSRIRSVLLEQPARAGQPTVFQIEYEYTAWGVSFDLHPEAVTPCDPHDPALQPWLREAPHVVFTPALRALARQLVGDETNPYRQAKAFYDWIAENIKYSYAIEYSTIRNISDYCRARGYGDCGQEALLFIALCRVQGIPARWQSAWNTFPSSQSIHDWCEIYLAPYGWMPVDPYQGIWAMQYAFTLTPAQRREIRDFYFGGLDPYRMAANADHNQELTPPKQSPRSDPVDFQRGELEAGGRNLYFDKYTYRMVVKELP